MVFLSLALAQNTLEYTSDIWWWLFSTVGVPWGPLYLFFFGYLYRLISGDFGVVKGLIFAFALCAGKIYSAILWQYAPPDPIAVWGDMLRIITTFVFTGVLMDWAVTGFSWPEIRRSYSSPAFTTLIAVSGTIITTVLTDHYIER